MGRCFLFLCAVASSAFATTIVFAGETLRVDFQLAPPSCPGGPCDTLLVFPMADIAMSPVVGEVALSDGATTLGAQFGVYAPVFRSADSLYSELTAATVDFSSIWDGTIQGSITFSVVSGSMTWFGAPGLNLVLGRSLAPGLVIEGTAVAITSVSIYNTVAFAPAELEVRSNPEPGTIWLALGGWVVLWGLRRCR